ncbi:hypothetical protein MalM25_21390 [Planctomycetes bacterium MalM25]|nr:hypothetical protein MalM25_21390 [Planctomycetes bacterium MalM25]
MGLLIAGLAGSPCSADTPKEASNASDKRVIGATAEVVETLSGLKYQSRIDTGATTCSIHAENLKVEEGEKSMLKNIGKKVAFDLIDREGKRKRVEAVIADTVRVRTSDGKERRYKVWLTLRHAGFERRVHVTLNDRKHMDYRLLIGRNFLCGKFLVDVEQKTTPMKVASAEKKETEQDDAG